MRAEKNVIFDFYSTINAHSVLDFNVVAYLDSNVDVNVFPMLQFLPILAPFLM